MFAIVCISQETNTHKSLSFESLSPVSPVAKTGAAYEAIQIMPGSKVERKCLAKRSHSSLCSGQKPVVLSHYNRHNP